MEASVIWSENKKYNISGYISFYQKDIEDPVQIVIYLKGLPDGFHGIHIHEKGIEELTEDSEDCCDKLGGHFNVGPTWSLENQSGTKHGVNGHNGDLCNNIYFHNNIAEKKFLSDKISLFEEDEKYIINRSIIIHQDRDDCALIDYKDEEKNIQKLITGNAGKRIACGNIEKVN